MSYVRLKHTLSSIALASLADPGRAAAAPAMAAYAALSPIGDAVPAAAIARRAAMEPSRVRRALLATGLFTDGADGPALAAPYRPHAAYFHRQAARLAEALRLAERHAPPGVPLEVYRGAALFNAGLFFECHEYLEDVWRNSRPPEREFYHGLVQAAAGCYHAEKGNAHGAAVLLGKARAKLTAYGPRFLSVDVDALLTSLDPVERAARNGFGQPASRPYSGPRPVLGFAA